MDLKTRLESDLKDAMRAGNDLNKQVIRMVLAAMKLAAAEKNAVVIDDSVMVGIIQKEIKSRKESIADATKANRKDLADGYEQEISVLETYLPKQLSHDDLEKIIKTAIAETGASLPSDMGKVMKLVIPQIQGRAANDQVSSLVRSLLTGS